MRTLRKTLCLTLVLTMLLGLVSVGASAAITVPDYSDADKIQYTEAVDVLSAIGVLQGDENGFRPTDTLTRAEACKIVVYLLGMNGVQGTAPFSDSASHWATSEIAYCAREGIVAGYGDGTFGPNDTLTGSQFAKMLLVALGYDAEAEGMVGQPWEIGVAKLVKQTELDDGIKAFDQTANLTREEAAQLAFNTIMTPIVDYDTKSTNIAVNGANISIGGSSWSYVVNKNSLADHTIYGANKAVVNTTQGVGINVSLNTGLTVEFGEEYIKDLKLEGRDVQMDAFGRPSRTWLYKNEEIGEYIQKQWLLGTYTKKVASKDLYDLLGKTIYDSLKDGDCDLYGTLNGYRYADIVNGVATNNNIDRIINKANTFAVNDSGNGTVTEVYMDDSSDTVYVASWHTYVFQALGGYDSAREIVTLTPAGDTSEGNFILADRIIDVDDFPQIKDLKADDYVLVTGTATNGDGRNGEVNDGRYDVQEIDKAELLKGKVDSYVTEDPYNVTIAGTTYSYSKTAKDGEDNVKSTKYSLGNEATLVMDKYGYVIDVDAALAVGDYVFVREFGSTASTIRGDALAEAYFADGTDRTINVRAAVDSATSKNPTTVTNATTIQNWNGNDLHRNKWYTFSKNSSSQYSLYKIENKYLDNALTNTTLGNVPGYDGSKDGNLVIENGKVRFLAGYHNDLYANTKTIMLVRDGTPTARREELTVYTGVDDIPDIKLTGATGNVSVVVAAKDNGYVDFAFVDVTGAAKISGGKNINLVYVYKYNGVEYSSGNNAVYRYILLDDDGKEVTRNADNKIDDEKYFAAYYVREDSDGIMTDFTKAEYNLAYEDGVLYSDMNQTVLEYSNGALTLGNQKYTLASDAKIICITLGNGKKTSGMDASILNRNKNADYEFNRYTSGKALSDRLEPYSIVFDYAAKVDETDGLMIKELFVTVKDARNAGTAGSIVTAPSNTTQLTATATGAAQTYLTRLNNGDIDRVTFPAGWTVTGTYSVSAKSNSTGYNIWVTGDLDINENANLSLNVPVYVTGDVNVDGKLLMNDGGSLTVLGKVTPSAKGHIEMNGGDINGNTADIYGNSLVLNKGTLTFTGKVNVYGRFEIAKAVNAFLKISDDFRIFKGATVTLGGSNSNKANKNPAIEFATIIVDAGASVEITGSNAAIETLDNYGTVNFASSAMVAIEEVKNNVGATVTTEDGSYVAIEDLTNNGDIYSDGYTSYETLKPSTGTMEGVVDAGATNVVVTFDPILEISASDAREWTAQGDDIVYTLADDATTLTLSVYNTSKDTVLVTVDATSPITSTEFIAIEAETYAEIKFASIPQKIDSYIVLSIEE